MKMRLRFAKRRGKKGDFEGEIGVEGTRLRNRERERREKERERERM